MTESTSKNQQQSGPDQKKKNLIGTDHLAGQNEENSESAGSEDTVATQKDAAVIASDNEGAKGRVLDLGQTLNIRDLDDLHQKLKSLIEQDGEVSLDASHIQKADAVSLQMLAAFYQSGPAQGIKVNWSGCSEDFREFGELLGITEILGIDSVQ